MGRMFRRTRASALLAFLLLSIPPVPSFAAIDPAASPADPKPLSYAERDRLRFKLEEHFNQLDLMVRNQNADRRDIERQEREMAYFRVFDRVPLEERIPELTRELRETAGKNGLRVEKLSVTGRRNPGKTPSRIWSDAKYRLDPEQVVSELRLKAVVKGDLASIRRWTRSWPEDMIRLVEPRGAPSRSGPGLWIVPLKAYRFTDTEFPRIELRDPREYLPEWARNDPQRFARSEPLLWSFVTRAEELKPRAEPLFENRRKFLVNAARMNLYLRKTLRKPG